MGERGSPRLSERGSPVMSSGSDDERSAPDTPGRGGPREFGIWWLSPPGALTLVVPVTLIMAWLLPSGIYQSKWRTQKALTDGFVWVLAVGALTLILFSLLPLVWRRNQASALWPSLGSDQLHRLGAAGTFIFRLTLFGYLALLLVGFARGARPSDFLQVLVSQNNLSGSLKQLFAPVSGITSFTQLGIAYAVVGTVLVLTLPNARNIRRLAVVLLLGLLRAFFLSERLAVLELLVPMVAIGAMWALVRGSVRLRTVIQFAPVFLIPMVAGLFSLFEYSRSWVWYRENGASSFLSFAVDRFGGYYATAYNNGQILYTYQSVPGRLPYRSIEGFWSAPGIEQLGLYDLLEQARYPPASEVFALHGNPEFNNPCGLCDPFVDWGSVGGWVFLACVGFLIGLGYLGFVSGRPTGLLTYPPMITGLYEIPRYIYWTAGRALPAIVTLAAVGWWLQRAPAEVPARGDSGLPVLLAGPAESATG